MTTTTIHHRFLLAIMAIAPAIVAAAYAWPVRAVLTQVEIASAFGLAASGLLLAVGVSLIVDWRRKRRNWLEWVRAYDAEVARISDPGPPPTTLEEALATGWIPVEGSGHVIYTDGSSEPRPLPGWSYSEIPGPATELQRHLTDALSVMLRHPELTVDAGTLRMLSRKPPVQRGKDGRFKSGRE